MHISKQFKNMNLSDNTHNFVEILVLLIYRNTVIFQRTFNTRWSSVGLNAMELSFLTVFRIIHGTGFVLKNHKFNKLLYSNVIT